MNIVSTALNKPNRVYVTPANFPLPKRIDTDIPGLTCRFTFGDERDDYDQIDWGYPYANGWPTEFSNDNQEVLQSYLKHAIASCNKLVIVEIGVCRNIYNLTSTSILIDGKRENDIYIGIDIENKSHLNNPSKNIYTLQSRSEDFNRVSDFFKTLGVSQIDILMIDGFHSINQVYQEWKLYTPLVSKGGIIIFHDTNSHPGPCSILESIDTTKYRIYKYCNDLRDWGISVVIDCNQLQNI